jgi:tetratricopeptide (TPR) repeat protein
MAGDGAGAIQALERAAALIPLATGDDNPNKRIAQIALEAGDSARAIDALEAVMKVDHADVESARQLVSLLEAAGDTARLEDAYSRLAAIDPFDVTAQAGLGQFALQRQDADEAIRAFRTALAANPPDLATAHVNLAQAYLLGRQPADAKRETLAALEIAPAFERAQDLLLEIVGADGSTP